MAVSNIKRIAISPAGNAYWIDDFDNLPNGGLCWVNQPMAHTPDGTSTFPGHVLTYKTIPTHGFQVALRYNANSMYVRTVVDGVWGDWKQIAMSAV